MCCEGVSKRWCDGDAKGVVKGGAKGVRRTFFSPSFFQIYHPYQLLKSLLLCIFWECEVSSPSHNPSLYFFINTSVWSISAAAILMKLDKVLSELQVIFILRSALRSVPLFLRIIRTTRPSGLSR